MQFVAFVAKLLCMNVTHLECALCGLRHEAGVLQNLCVECGKPLLVRYDLEKAAAGFEQSMRSKWNDTGVTLGDSDFQRQVQRASEGLRRSHGRRVHAAAGQRKIKRVLGSVVVAKAHRRAAQA